MNVKQIMPHRFPSGDSYTIAMLKYEPDELAAIYHIKFEEDYDDLDYFKFAALEDAQIGQIVLQRYKNNEVNGTDILVDSMVDVKTGIEAIRQMFDLKEGDIAWVNPR